MWLYHRVMSPHDADGMANSVDPDQTAPLIWVCTVCPGISVQKLRIIAVTIEIKSWLLNFFNNAIGIINFKGVTIYWYIAVSFCQCNIPVRVMRILVYRYTIAVPSLILIFLALLIEHTVK